MDAVAAPTRTRTIPALWREAVAENRDWPAYLVEQEFVGSLYTPDLPHDIIRAALVFERAIPTLQLFIEFIRCLLVPSPVIALKDATTQR